MKKLLIAGLALGLAGLAAPAWAKPLPGGVTAEEVASALKAKGLKAEITKDGVGDPMVKSSSNGANWSVYFYNCKDGRCASIQFSSGFDMPDGTPLVKINEWNFTKRFSRASLDDEQDPFVRYDIDAEKGFTTEALDLAIETWQIVLPGFIDFIGYEPA